MRETTRKTNIPISVPALVPDGNRGKPPISSSSPQRQLKKRDSVSSEVSSSRPNSTTSEGNDDGSTDDEEGEDGTTATSDFSEPDDEEDDSSNYGDEKFGGGCLGVGGGLDPISEEASIRKRSEDENGDTTPEIDTNSSSEEDETNTPRNDGKWSSTDEETSFFKDKTPLYRYDSTCCDEDFTWVRSDPPVEKQHSHQHPLHTPQAAPTTTTTTSSSSTTISKPPGRPSGSLDRRRQQHGNRNERDHKSRSTHSLKEKSLSGELLKENYQRKDNRRDAGYQSESYINHYRRGSPGFWEPPPPPTYPYPGYEIPHYWGCHTSREELRMYDQYRRHDYFRYGSSGALPISASQELFHTGNCCSRYPPPASSCCGGCDHRTVPWNGNQRQDTDERLRRLQGDKESLALQVQVLTEQVSAQNDKIIDLERSLTDKTQLLNNTEDMLQRVSAFAKSVDLQLDRQKEMLSRSSLETQKLELMSAMSELKLQQAALERENLELRTSQANNNSLPPRRPPPTAGRLLSSTPHTSLNSITFHGSIGSLQQSTNASPIAPKTPPASFRHQVNPHFSSLPRTSFTSTTTTTTNGSANQTKTMTGAISSSQVDSNANPKQRNVAFAETEKVIEDTMELPRSYTPQPTTSPSLGQKSKGFRSIFGKIKRSNSGNLEDLPGDGEFKRGGIRATAGARLGWSNAHKPNKPFKEWNINDICIWFEEMGLSVYEEEAKKWLKQGAVDLIEASPVDIEKELNLKSSLHRKKISLAVAELSGKETDTLMLNAGKLDTAWIMRWLDDIGLPQHKDGFSAARIDGRMLHKMTMDDLATMHVTSCLHVASLRRGIQIMRENHWNPDCLIRRSNTDSDVKESVELWTAHRVMEWLRVVDLAEYAPNLRGAGVHGALMMFEPKFTAELLSDLLSIPPSKTLLRRHLATHFKELLGRDIIQAKRDAENTLGYQPLTIASKIKTPKKSQFSLKRKKSAKGGDEWSDFVCPMGGSSGDHLLTTTSTSNQNSTATGISMTNQMGQEIAAGVEGASLPNSAGSPTSSRSSNSVS